MLDGPWHEAGIRWPMILFPLPPRPLAPFGVNDCRGAFLDRTLQDVATVGAWKRIHTTGKDHFARQSSNHGHFLTTEQRDNGVAAFVTRVFRIYTHGEDTRSCFCCCFCLTHDDASSVSAPWEWLWRRPALLTAPVVVAVEACLHWVVHAVLIVVLKLWNEVIIQTCHLKKKYQKINIPKCSHLVKSHVYTTHPHTLPP